MSVTVPLVAWTITDDLHAYDARVRPLLAADPTRYTVALTAAEGALAGRWPVGGRPVLGWYADPEVRGAVCWFPPYELHLAAVPPDTMDGLVHALRRYGAEPGQVHGTPATARAFAGAWTRGTALRTETTVRLRLYRLGDLHRPDTPGRARQASAADLDTVLGLTSAFLAEVGGPGSVTPDAARADIGDGRVWLWTVDDEPVALAAHKPAVAGVARVGPVYTPPEHRGRGYGSGVTAACTAAAAAGGAGVVLFTDLANPTSNAIYQRLGYRPVEDREVLSFLA